MLKLASNILWLALCLVLTLPRGAASSSLPSPPQCLHVTAALSGTNYGFYLFSGNQFTYYHPMLAMSAMSNGDTVARVSPISDIAGMSPDTEITAGYMEPHSTQEVRLFDKNAPIAYRVNIEEKKLLGTESLDSMFSESELSSIKEDGIQAAAVLGEDRYFFSGCKVLKTDFNGNVETLSLSDTDLPCNVDSAFAYPKKDTNHLLVTKDAQAYGWFMGTRPVSNGYYMFCTARVFTNIALNLCDCDE